MGINFVQLLGLNASEVREDKVWMISIISTSKYLLYKKKLKDKNASDKADKKSKKRKKKKKIDEADLSDIEISNDEDDDDESESAESGSDDDLDEAEGEKAKAKQEEIVKSELIVALEALYEKIGQPLP